MKRPCLFYWLSIFSYFIALLLASCTGNAVDISKLVAERDSLKESLLAKQNENENLSGYLQAVSEGLDSIAIQERFIRDGGPEGTSMKNKEQMKKCLQELADILARQRARIAALEDSLNLGGSGAKNLHNIVSFLNEQLAAKEKTINQLRSEIDNKNLSIAQLQSRIQTLNENVDSLGRTNIIQREILVKQSDMMNECYIKIGTKKELKQAGFLNGSKLNPAALTPEKCVKVDIRQLLEMQLNSKKPKILTTMPQNAYSIHRNPDNTSTLIIDDPALFWSSSNYLVISLE